MLERTFKGLEPCDDDAFREETEAAALSFDLPANLIMVAIEVSTCVLS